MQQIIEQIGSVVLVDVSSQTRVIGRSMKLCCMFVSYPENKTQFRYVSAASLSIICQLFSVSP
jgi:hypothetical protein